MNLHNYSIKTTYLISAIFLMLLLLFVFLLLHKYAYNYEKARVTCTTSSSLNRVINSTIAKEYNSKDSSHSAKPVTDFLQAVLIPAIEQQVSAPLEIKNSSITIVPTSNEKQVLASNHPTKEPDNLKSESIAIDFFIPCTTVDQNYTCYYKINDMRVLVITKLKSAMFFTILLILFFIIIFAFIINRWKTGSKESKLKDDFFQNVTHELKTPIATTAIATDLFKKFDYSLTPEKTKNYIDIIIEENRKMKLIVDRLLSISIVDNSQSKMVLADVDIQKVVSRTVKSFKFLVTERGGKIEEVAEATQSVIWGDESFVTMIFTNLIDNAIKYSIKAPKIKVSTRSDQKGIYISVADQGIGMPAEALSKIFIKAYRVKNNHNVKGFGLGLYFVKQLVDIHKGKIEVKSELNKGTEFTVFLPFSRNKEEK
jgi:two-component system phosphate regulon sensor histidine kinase PhoR